MADLWHYTCDHGAPLIRADGFLRPSPHPMLPEPLVWLTDLDTPFREALGLTSLVLSCDRTSHRFRVARDGATPWTKYRRQVDAWARHALESAPGAMPAHWWVSPGNVPLIVEEASRG